jgi:hypothetical protein
VFGGSSARLLALCGLDAARRDRLPTGDFDFTSDISRVYTSPADDVILVKVSYWFGGRR